MTIYGVRMNDKGKPCVFDSKHDNDFLEFHSVELACQWAFDHTLDEKYDWDTLMIKLGVCCVAIGFSLGVLAAAAF